MSAERRRASSGSPFEAAIGYGRVRRASAAVPVRTIEAEAVAPDGRP